MPSWNLLAQLTPTSDEWAFTAPTESGWFKLEQRGQIAYPGSAIALIAEAEFMPNGEVVRTEAKRLYHSFESQTLLLPPPLVFTPGQRRIAVKRLARTPSYTPWQLLIYQSNLMAIYDAVPNISKEQPVADSAPSPFVAPAYAVATPAANYRAATTNTNRRRIAVTNNGTAPIRIDFDPPTSATSHYLALAVGSSWEPEYDYTGELYVWSSNATTQAITVREFI